MDSECLAGTCDAEGARRPACGLVSNTTDSHLSLLPLGISRNGASFGPDNQLHTSSKTRTPENLGERYCKEVFFKWWGEARHLLHKELVHKLERKTP